MLYPVTLAIAVTKSNFHHRKCCWKFLAGKFFFAKAAKREREREKTREREDERERERVIVF